MSLDPLRLLAMATDHGQRRTLARELERDAKRYRWLKENTYVEAYWIDGAGGVDTHIRVQGAVHFLDEAIDEAMADAAMSQQEPTKEKS